MQQRIAPESNHNIMIFGSAARKQISMRCLKTEVFRVRLLFSKEYCLQGLRFDTLGGALEQLPDSLGDLFSPVAFTIVSQWLLFQILLDRVLPGKVSKRSNRDSDPTSSSAIAYPGPEQNRTPVL